METLQTRIPKQVLQKVDLLIKSGIFRNRSEIIRQALQEFILHSNYNGIAPLIVGPFSSPNLKKILDAPPETFLPPKNEMAAIQKKFKRYSGALSMQFTRWWKFNPELNIYPITIKITHPMTKVSIVKNFIFDTGFTGYLGLDHETISALNLIETSKGNAFTVSGDMEYHNYSAYAEILNEQNLPLYPIKYIDEPPNIIPDALLIPIQDLRIPLIGMKAIIQFNWIYLAEKKWIGLFE